MRHRSRNAEKVCCKVSIYFQEPLIQQILAEAQRLDRSISWVVQRCIASGGLESVQGIEAAREVAE